MPPTTILRCLPTSLSTSTPPQPLSPAHFGLYEKILPRLVVNSTEAAAQRRLCKVSWTTFTFGRGWKRWVNKIQTIVKFRGIPLLLPFWGVSFSFDCWYSISLKPFCLESFLMFSFAHQIFSLSKDHRVEVCLAPCVVAKGKNWLVRVAEPDLKEYVCRSNENEPLVWGMNWEVWGMIVINTRVILIVMVKLTWSMASLRRTSTFFSR